jgi:hypothetical protein
MSGDGDALVEALFREARERLRGQPWPPATRSGIPYTELPAAEPGDECAEEWNTYRGEVGRLLADGLEGKFALIRGRAIVGIYDTGEAAWEEGLRTYFPQPLLVQQVRSAEPILRIRGYNVPWPVSLSQLPGTD